jgi:MscS family membrane protein
MIMENFINLLSDVWNRGFYGVNLSDIIISLIVLLAAFLLRGFIIATVLNAIGRLAAKTESKVDDEILSALEKPLGLVPVTIALYIITLILPLSGTLGDSATNIVKAFVVFTIFSALANSIKPIFEALSTSSWLTASMQMWLERASRAIVWIVGLGVILDIFGIQIGPLVAGLGLFSVAVALGAQDFFKNLIAGILIIGENRFQPGDRIQVSGKLHGIVDTIGFRSTVVRQFDTSPMIIPNKDLSDVMVINHAGIINRRLDWKINLIYSTSVEQLESIRSEIKDYIVKSDDFASDGDLEPVVRVIELGSSSIDIMIVCYSDPCGFAAFCNTKETLIFNIMKIVEKNNSEFAFPSTSLYLESTPEKS